MKLLAVFITLFVFLCSERTYAGTVDLPETGQTTSYSQGDDGELRKGISWPDPRFTIGTGPEADCVTDNLTGSMWLKDANLPAGTRNWQGALDYVTSINSGAELCGYTDWRLPDINELESLVNAKVQNTAVWLNGKGFVNVQSANYWSSTTLARSSLGAWFVSMWYGSVEIASKDYSAYVWPIRSDVFPGTVQLPQTGQTISYSQGDDGELQTGVSWPDPRFTVGTGAEADCATDNLTGLIWPKNANLPNGVRNWQGALDYVASINSGAGVCGYTDWRLPNRKEIRSLIDYSKFEPALPSNHPFTNVQLSYYWSSTTYADDTNRAWLISIWEGPFWGGMSYGVKASAFYLWPVRSGQIDSFDYYCDEDNDNHKNFSITNSCQGSNCIPAGCQIMPGDDCDDNDNTIYTGAPELCDNKDNDCDGPVDENLTRSTTCGTGECTGNTGAETCSAGIWGNDTCDPFAGATSEICDGLDNNCDGQTNEGLQYQLITSVNPTGNGTVDLDCSGGCSYNCLDPVIINAYEYYGYPFNNWTGCDFSSGAICTITMNADKNVTAIFNSCMYPARVIGTSTAYFDYIQDAFDNATADNTIETQSYVFVDNDLIINNAASLMFRAGYDCNYSSNEGVTTINGNMTTSDGTLTIQSGTLQIQ